jgi:hypothetical protein
MRTKKHISRLLIAIGISTTILVSSCNRTIKGDLHRCVITQVTVTDPYGGMIPNEKNYIYKTDCGYTVAGSQPFNIGDTISIIVVDKNSMKLIESYERTRNTIPQLP